MEASSFWKLPAELRNEIYKITLHEPKGIRLRKYKDAHKIECYNPPIDSGWDTPYDPRLRPLALAQTCKEIRSESRSLFFALNAFHLKTSIWKQHTKWSIEQCAAYRTHLNICKDWLYEIGEENAANIPRLVIAGQKLKPLRSATVVYNGEYAWWFRARKIEKEIFKRVLAVDIIYTSITFEPDGWMFGRKPDWDTFAEYTTLTLPTANKDQVEDAVEDEIFNKWRTLTSACARGIVSRNLRPHMADALQDARRYMSGAL